MNPIFDSNVHPLYSIMAFISAIIVGLISYASSKNLFVKNTRHKLIYIWVIFFCLQDGLWGIFASWSLRSDAGLYISSYVFHLSAILSPVFWTVYFLSRVSIGRKWKLLFTALSALLTLAQLIMLVFNISTRFMFYVDANGLYKTTPARSVMFYMQFATYIVMCVLSFYAYFKYERGTGRSNLFAIAAVSIAPIFFGAFQMVYPDAPYDSVGFAVASVVIHCFLSVEYEKQVITLRELKDNLDLALEDAQAANKAKSTFLFNMSHDIRTPMNAIIGFTNIAEKNIGNPEKVSDCLKKTRDASSLLLSMINDILEMSRIENGKAELTPEPADVLCSFDLIDSVLTELAKEKHIDISYETGKIRDRGILVDKMRFNRVLLNLGTNAIKYTPVNGKVQLSVRQLDGETADGHRLYEYTVADNGSGMSEEFQAHMFEEFSRERTSTTSGIQGTGLGLAVTKAYVDMMDGRIECRSRIGEGTVFTVVLPFAPCETDFKAPEASRDLPEDAPGFSFSGKRVLLVEDNEMNREIATEILGDAGITVETAVDGSKAVDAVRTHGTEYYDLILMDIQMPVMDGYEATRTIRSLYPDSRLPIIALSANAFAEDRVKSRQAGMNDHIEKPIRLEELFSAIQRIMK